MITVIIPMFGIALVVIIVIYYFAVVYYLATSREVKRWQSVLNSPIFNLFSETIAGVCSIRAFKTEKTFCATNAKRIDRDHTAYFTYICSNRWLATRLEFIGTFIVFSACTFAILERHNLNAGLIGLVVSYSMSLTQSLNWMIRMSSQIETNIVSVERIEEYIKVAPEKPKRINGRTPPVSWPLQGSINIENLHMRYRANTELILKGVNLNIEGGERVGIVGRTGSGKSSLFVALMRLVECEKGTMIVDGIDISKNRIA
eukprot:UN23612